MNDFMKIKVKRWGNSVGIRIPKPFADQVGVADGSVLEMVVIKNKIVLEKPELTLDELLEKVTPANIHPETDTGPVIGKEQW